MLHLHSALPSAQLAQQRVFLRADLNVPLHGSTILDDYRLCSILPTIQLIQQRGGKVILATHLGRPHGIDPLFSTRLLIPWFEQRGFSIHFASDLDAAYDASFAQPQALLLLENLRFFDGEKSLDHQFAQKLARLADYYVHDAFGLAHESAASITIVPTLFAPDKRTIGLLIEKELHELNQLLDNPRKPFVLIIGGNKIEEKLPLIKALIPKVDTILLCPALVFTVLKSLGKPVGKSLVEASALAISTEIMTYAKNHNVPILFPEDYTVTKENFEGELLPNPVAAQQFPDDAYGMTIGPKTEKLWKDIIKNAHTIFYNGLMGDMTRTNTLHSTKTLFTAMSEAQGVSIVGGGDTVAAARTLGYASKLSYLSTGGGATLAYLSGAPMPSLALFLQKKDSKNRTETQ